jgi:hypothetical protein
MVRTIIETIDGGGAAPAGVTHVERELVVR